jgi:hypothetical protein
VATAPPPNEPVLQYVLGFAFFKTQMGPLMGDPVELEHGNPDNCDTQQLTTTGLAYWRCASNLLSFAAFPDGQVHWAAVDQGLMEWVGDADPPPDAPVIQAAQQGGNPDRPATACLAAAQVPSLMCSMDDNPTALGTITETGETNTFHFSVPASGARVTVDLVDLPADYDLYLADASGAILAQSVQEGTTPEQVQMNVDGGDYYLYVHSDPGRPVDPQDPYQLDVSITNPVAADAPAPPTPGEAGPGN